jgi:hypothetical protein
MIKAQHGSTSVLRRFVAGLFPAQREQESGVWYEGKRPEIFGDGDIRAAEKQSKSVWMKGGKLRKN